jgi:hypothetical protein
MKHLFFFLLLMPLASKISFSQEHNIHPVKYIFDPNADAKADLNNAEATAAQEHKHLFILIGGDWSQASIEFNTALNKEYVQKVLNDNYVFLRLNFSPSNKNEEVLQQLGCPKYDGYPILMVLDENGKNMVTKTADDFRVAPHNYFAPKIEKYLRDWAAQKNTK